MDPRIRQSLRHNVIANLLDGGFFGFAFGFASIVTILPLFVSTMTDSALLIGLIPAIHMVGWQFPQLLTANRVSRQKRYKPMVLLATIHERLPFLGLALIAWFLPTLGAKIALPLTFVMLIWQGLGGGFTATAWQSMIGKIIPSDRRGTFYGAQSSAANLLSSLGALLAGIILDKLGSPQDFSLLFLLASLAMAISFFSLAQTREPENLPVDPSIEQPDFWTGVRIILRRDGNFRWFLVARMLSQLAIMGFAFYTVYAVGQGISDFGVGVMTAIYLASQIVFNPMVGWIGDHGSHRALIEIGVASAAASGLLAWWAPNPTWFYLVFVLAGLASVAIWTSGLAMILEFGTEREKPAYIGLGNTLVAPATILAPFLGGWLADHAGYRAAFLASVAGGVVSVIVLQLFVRDPQKIPASQSKPVKETFGD